jgi:prepilin-type N-terminal cleavage/methylation domain-containing protein
MYFPRFKLDSFQKGFSVMELLVVLLISSIISLIVIPNYSKIQELAKNHTLKNQGHTLQLALQSYELEVGTFPDSSSGIEGLISTLTASNYLKSTPKNPYTNSAFTNNDSSGLIIYNYDIDSASYTLELHDYLNETVILELTN